MANKLTTTQKQALAKLVGRRATEQSRKFEETFRIPESQRTTISRRGGGGGGGTSPAPPQVFSSPLLKQSFASSESRTFKVVAKGKKVRNAISKPVNKPLSVPRGYFTDNRKKLRNFRIIKGKRVPLRNTFIEKRKNLLDTKREKRKITLSKLTRRKVKKKKIKGGKRK